MSDETIQDVAWRDTGSFRFGISAIRSGDLIHITDGSYHCIVRRKSQCDWDEVKESTAQLQKTIDVQQKAILHLAKNLKDLPGAKPSLDEALKILDGRA